LILPGKTVPKMTKLLLLILSVPLSMAHGQAIEENYPIDSASVQHPGVPKGEVLKFSFGKSAVFAGTSRDYWVYVPAQYSPGKPACVYVNQDGIQWNAPIVFDNLISGQQMPVTIGVFVAPGRVLATNASMANDRFNRSFEYDGLGDAYVRFLLYELLPDVERQKTSDGRPIRLSLNGNDRAIGGSSSGAVCAFTAAWERPTAFSRVFSAIGTYVGLRGADRYPTLVRKYEPKPLRVFLQDGSSDLNIYGGDWWKANETMERALAFSGYELKHSWGGGGHNGKQGTSVFPEAMRWLWKDWPAPITTGKSKNTYLADLLLPGQDWELVGSDYRFTEGIAVNATGQVFFQDIANSKTYQADLSGKLKLLDLDAKKASGTSFTTDGRRVVTAGGTKQVISYDRTGKQAILADSLTGNDLVVGKNGNIYITQPDGMERPSKIYLLKPNGERLVVDEGLRFANGLAFTPDQSQLYIAESASQWIWIYRVNDDGTLSYKQRFGWLHAPDTAPNAWADGLKCDTAGRVFVATRLGIQVMDQLGRVNAILPLPAGQASNCCFGGPGFNIMYVSCGDKVYRRKLNTRGANNFEEPVKPKLPSL
jgi:gluconolactonase